MTFGRAAAVSVGAYVVEENHMSEDLVWNGEQYRCAMAEQWGAELYIGEGCCAALNTWRLDVRNRDRCRTERGWP